MTILITDDGYIAEGKQPEVGKRYYLTDAESGTEAQNKAFHALVQEYFKSGAFSYPAKTFQELKDFIKRDLGAGFENFVYATPEGIKRATTTDEIPEEYRTAQYTMGRLKSWSKYTKRERRETMDALIAQMLLVGVQTKKFNEIMTGLEGLWQKKD